jgi:hypothetical protein
VRLRPCRPALRERATDSQPRRQYAPPWRPSDNIIDGRLFPVPAKAQRDDHSDDIRRCLRAPPTPSRSRRKALPQKTHLFDIKRNAEPRTSLLSRTAHRHVLCGRRLTMSRSTPSRSSQANSAQPRSTRSLFLPTTTLHEHGLRRNARARRVVASQGNRETTSNRRAPGRPDLDTSVDNRRADTVNIKIHNSRSSRGRHLSSSIDSKAFITLEMQTLTGLHGGRDRTTTARRAGPFQHGQRQPRITVAASPSHFHLHQSHQLLRGIKPATLSPSRQNSNHVVARSIRAGHRSTRHYTHIAMARRTPQRPRPSDRNVDRLESSYAL